MLLLRHICHQELGADGATHGFKNSNIFFGFEAKRGTRKLEANLRVHEAIWKAMLRGNR